MIHIRDEGGQVRTGFNFYPLASNQFGFVFKLFDSVLYMRYPFTDTNLPLGKRTGMNEFNLGPIIGTAIAIAGMLFALVMGYLIGYNDAKEGR